MPKKLSSNQLVSFLQEVACEIERGASYEGSLEYSCVDDACAPGEFLVTAAVRNSNDLGQGGYWIVRGEE